MEIEFNPSRIPKPEFSQLVARQSSSSAAPDAASFSTAASLQGKLNDVALVRPETVDRAKALLSDDKYPPGYVVDRIAALLAFHINK